MHEGRDPKERERETLRQPSLLVLNRDDSERIGRKTDGGSRNCCAEADREGGPSIEKGHQRSIGFSQVDVIPSCMRQGGPQLSVDHSATEGKDCSDEPQQENQLRIAQVSGHESRRGEDTPAYDVA